MGFLSESHGVTVEGSVSGAGLPLVSPYGCWVGWLEEIKRQYNDSAYA